MAVKQQRNSRGGRRMMSWWYRGAVLLVGAAAFGLGYWELGVVLVGFVALDWFTRS